MSVGKIIVFAVVLGAAIMVMRAKGLSVGDVLQLAKEEIALSKSETKAVMSGEYTDRYAKKLSEEVAKLPEASARRGSFRRTRDGNPLAPSRPHPLVNPHHS